MSILFSDLVDEQFNESRPDYYIFEYWIDTYFPSDIEFYDLGAEVHSEEYSYPSGGSYKRDAEIGTDVPAADGTIDTYTLDLSWLTLDQCLMCVAKYLNKPDINSITEDDLDKIDEDKLFDFLYDELFEQAQLSAQADYDDGKIEDDEVNGQDSHPLDDYWPEP